MSHSDHGATTSSSSTSSHSMMVPYLHFTGGDFLFFNSWQPHSAGVIVGACIGLIVLAMFERWLVATRTMFMAYWQQRTSLLTAARDQAVTTRSTAKAGGSAGKYYVGRSEMFEMSRQGSSSSPSPIPDSKGINKAIINSRARTVAPFIAAHDIPRGILFALQMLISYILMLAVMTFQAAYLIAIVLGLGLGEVVFGRVTGATGH